MNEQTAGSEPPLGERFSHVYIDPGAPTRDSERLRRRVAAYFDDQFRHHRGFLAGVLNLELGIDISRVGGMEVYYDFSEFFRKAATRDFLDAITLLYQAMTAVDGYRQSAAKWLRFVERAMREENIGYRIDPHGGVHPFVDAEFERNRAATIQSLGKERYAAALEAFEAAHTALEQDPPDTRASVRSAFDAVENVFKLITGPSVLRLGAGEVNKHLRPRAQRVYAATARFAVSHMLSAFADWIDGAHHYRHAPGTEEPDPPPLELAVIMVSIAASYLRWLIELDQVEMQARNQQPE